MTQKAILFSVEREKLDVSFISASGANAYKETRKNKMKKCIFLVLIAYYLLEVNLNSALMHQRSLESLQNEFIFKNEFIISSLIN